MPKQKQTLTKKLLMQTIKKILPNLFNVINNDYSAIATSETEGIISQFMHSNANRTLSATPTLTHVSGIPGAGKSTYINTHFANQEIVRFDNIMSELSEYKELIKGNRSVEAFTAYEMKARIIGYELLSRMIDAKHSIVLEHSLNPVHLPLYEELHKLGYDTRLIFITCNLETAQKRALNREIETGRHTPLSLINERFAIVDNLLPKFSATAKSFELIDGN